MDIYKTITKHNPSWGITGGCWFFVFLLCFSRIIKQSYKSNRINFSQSLAYIAIYIFLWTVLESTVFTRIPQAYPQYELHIFWSWKAFFVYHDNEMLKENILNCILLMPYGCLLPGALDKRISWKRGLVIGMGTSFVIELLQLITCRGLFEFDDIIHNGVGCMMGAVLGSWCWLRMLKNLKCSGSLTLPEHFLNHHFSRNFRTSSSGNPENLEISSGENLESSSMRCAVSKAWS